MTDARLPERWLNDRRLLRLTDGAHRLFVAALMWSVANRTDGRLERADLALIPGVDPHRADELVAAGLWEETSGGWTIGSFETTQTSGVELDRQDRERARDRAKKNRRRARQRAEQEEVGPAVPGDVPGGHEGDGPRGMSQDRTGQARTGNPPAPASSFATSSPWPDHPRNGRPRDPRAEALSAQGWDS